MNMSLSIVKKSSLSAFLVLVFVLLSVVPEAFAHRRPYRHHHSKTKHIAVGTAIGAVGGALIGGRKGALIGAGAGAGTGYVVYRHKKSKHRKYYRR
jgi:uncharacterized membrane protein